MILSPLLKIVWPYVLVYTSYRNRTPQTEWFKEETFISLQFWKLEIQGQGASTFSFWWELSSRLAHGHLLSVSSHGPSSVHRWRKSSLLSLPLPLRTHQSYWLRISFLWPCLSFTTSLKALSPNVVTLEVKTSAYEFGDTIFPIIPYMEEFTSGLPVPLPAFMPDSHPLWLLQFCHMFWNQEIWDLQLRSSFLSLILAVWGPLRSYIDFRMNISIS